jgi:glycosyltransferase involved in cell wall biosynthesis
VVCATFNQKKYIEGALDAFLAQVTSFPFEIVVHDDASTDGTAEIIQAYASQYPDIIKAVFQQENQYSKGGFKPSVYAARFARGRYIALCEGDDYWLDERKLELQVRALEKNLQADFCFHSAVVHESDSGEEWVSWQYGEDRVIGLAELLDSRAGAMAPTCSYMLRREVFSRLPEWFLPRAPIGDFFLECYGSLGGGAIYLDRPMSVYRKDSPGSWSVNVRGRYDAYLEFTAKMDWCLDQMQEDLQEVSASFARHRARLGLNHALVCLFNGDSSRFQAAIARSVNFCGYVSNKHRMAHRLRWFPLLVKAVLLTKRGVRLP